MGNRIHFGPQRKAYTKGPEFTRFFADGRQHVVRAPPVDRTISKQRPGLLASFGSWIHGLWDRLR